VPNPDNPQDFNRYAYVQNNPVRYVDPTGHCTGLKGFAYEVCKAAVITGKKVVDKLNEYREDIFFPDEDTTFTDRLEACSVVGGGSVLLAAAGTEIFAGTLTTAATTGGTTTLTTAATSTTAAACADGDCTNEPSMVIQKVTEVASRARVSYDPTLPAGEGATDKLGNITVSPHGSLLDQLQALYHEQVHRFFTPRGPLQGVRAEINMWAYDHSHLLQYVEEAIAESVAQLRTGGSLHTGLLFPLNGYVEPWRVILEAGGLLAGVTWTADTIADAIAGEDE
jgi:hypothetical protein